jgi:hypothetical protein
MDPYDETKKGGVTERLPFYLFESFPIVLIIIINGNLMPKAISSVTHTHF